MSYSYDCRGKTAAKGPTLLEASVEWTNQLAESLRLYFKRVGGGWSRVRPKTRIEETFRGVRVDLDGPGWSGYVKFQVHKGALQVEAWGDLKEERPLGADIDLMAILDKAPKAYEHSYPDNTPPEKVIKDISLYFSGIVDPLT